MHRRARLCVTVTAATTAELRKRRDEVGRADLVELRLDGVADPDVAGALSGRRTPVIVTCRPTWEGGRFEGPEDARHRLLEAAIAEGAEYIDVEWRAGFRDLLTADGGRRVVLSSHDFARVPADLVDRVRDMRGTGAAVVKVAVQADRLSDCLSLLGLGGDGERTVLIAMGEYGLPSRALATRFGSAWTYAGAIAEVGQVSAATLLDEYRFGDVDEATEVYGVTGSPVSQSLSPAMHNAVFRATGRNAVYLPLPAADADDFVGFARGVGMRGASVTIPYKVALLATAREVSPAARDVGALNTLRMSDGEWSGHNTDVAGFLRPLDDQGVALRGTRAAILGAGGSARAVALALASRGADVTVHGRRHDLAAEVAAIGRGRPGPWPPAAGSWDLLVNCTPIGMHPHVEATPLDREALTGEFVYDLVYNPAETRLLREARLSGCRTLGGLDMLVAQAEEQSQWWTGAPPPAGVMRRAATRRLSECAADADHVV